MKAIDICNKALEAIQDEGEIVWPKIPPEEGDPEFTEMLAYAIAMKLLEEEKG